MKILSTFLLIQAFLAIQIYGAEQTLLVGNYFRGKISSFSASDGASQGMFAARSDTFSFSPEGMTLGPDGLVYVVTGELSAPERVVRFNAITGELVSVFSVLGTDVFSNDLAFGPDGHLYVSYAGTNDVRRYNHITGEFMNIFASGAGMGDVAGIAFGPDGHLYVSSRETDEIRQFNGNSGALMGIWGAGSGLDQPAGLVFGPDGNLYVSSRQTDQVKRFNAFGQFLGNFASGSGLRAPGDLLFGPDGSLYVVSFLSDEIKRFDGSTGEFIDNFVGPSMIEYPTGILFVTVPEPRLYSLSLGILMCCTVRPMSRCRVI